MAFLPSKPKHSLRLWRSERSEARSDYDTSTLNWSVTYHWIHNSITVIEENAPICETTFNCAQKQMSLFFEWQHPSVAFRICYIPSAFGQVSVWQSATLVPTSCKSVQSVPARVEEPVSLVVLLRTSQQSILSQDALSTRPVRESRLSFYRCVHIPPQAKNL